MACHLIPAPQQTHLMAIHRNHCYEKGAVSYGYARSLYGKKKVFLHILMVDYCIWMFKCTGLLYLHRNRKQYVTRAAVRAYHVKQSVLNYLIFLCMFDYKPGCFGLTKIMLVMYQSSLQRSYVFQSRIFGITLTVRYLKGTSRQQNTHKFEILPSVWYNQRNRSIKNPQFNHHIFSSNLSTSPYLNETHLFGIPASKRKILSWRLNTKVGQRKQNQMP